MRATVRNVLVAGTALAFALATDLHASATYTYDELGRIRAVTYSDGKQIIYTYDAAGNRTQHVVSATTSNRPPVAVDDAKSATEGVATTFDPRTNDSDPDGNALTVTNVSQGENGTASVTGGGASITYTPTLGRRSADLITYSISDGNGMSASAVVNLTVLNGPPIPVSDTLTINQLICAPGHSLDPRANDTDPGQDPFTVTAVTNGAKGKATLGAGGTSVSYLPNGGQLGADSFSYTITDDEGASAAGTVAVTINISAQNPTAGADELAWTVMNNYDTSRTLDPRWNDTDPEAHPLVVVATTNGAKGITEILYSGTQVRYTRTSDFPTSAVRVKYDTFTYTVSDGCGGSAVGTVSVTVRYNSGSGPPGCGGSPCP